ncbi:Altered inheritance of mitochondria protein 6-like protein [Colletotrichum trifolii]|uniref:Altered inheritance of mitochondria protein 6 n=2 Tax=Colletotrichum trifolii TaxID=5466 RepID=A0A4V3HQK6_COLTR|nr:Altered inheritance of mitochondria protein 6-like protein [Colletotrichum trifolii]TDZ27589.1 Altered inheritance of mitochondria protein 6-like protein [Colletotrichum trifolii]TDZ28159.1 Altered inheritance of mitochondria protein 6-like protein [Colletotrichum trifolii]
MNSPNNIGFDAVRDRFRQLWCRNIKTTSVPRYRDVAGDAGEPGVGDAVTPVYSFASDEMLVPAYVVAKTWTRKRSFFMCGAVWLAMLLIFVLLNVVLLAARLVWDIAPKGINESNLVVPIPCHSHNDYWRKRPVHSAFNVGCVGIEADVWLRGTELFVGHDRWSLREMNTFTSLYINPLVRLLEERNAPFVNDTQQHPRGIYQANPEQTVVLLVDLKTSGPETWLHVVRQLEPLRQRGWLSTVVDGQVSYGPVTVVGTGNTIFELVVANSTFRDAFLDAPLNRLEAHDFNPTNSYYTSVSFRKAIGTIWFGDLSDTQLKILRSQIGEAHSRGLKVRYWDLPAWPINIRNHIWEVLVREGVDILNVDDLKGARKEWDVKGWPTLGANTTGVI